MDYDRSSAVLAAFFAEYTRDRDEWLTTEVAQAAIEHFSQEPGRLERFGIDLIYQTIATAARRHSASGRRGARRAILPYGRGIVSLERMQARARSKWLTFSLYGPSFGYKLLLKMTRPELLESRATYVERVIDPAERRVAFIERVIDALPDDTTAVEQALLPLDLERISQEVYGQAADGGDGGHPDQPGLAQAQG